MNLVELEEAIGTRIVASLTAASASYQGVFSEAATDGYEVKQGANPLVIFTLQVGEGADTFDANGADVVYRVWIYDHRKNGTANAKAVYGAILGNGTPDTAPTQGLHRWIPTASGLDVAMFTRTSFGHPHDGDTLRYFIDFSSIAEEA